MPELALWIGSRILDLQSTPNHDPYTHDFGYRGHSLGDFGSHYFGYRGHYLGYFGGHYFGYRGHFLGIEAIILGIEAIILGTLEV